jgi:citrate lyase subunit beta/citryl-CoA lyase
VLLELPEMRNGTRPSSATHVLRWRSILFVPVNVSRFVNGAHHRNADAIALDLEDSILPQDKAQARLLVPAAAAKAGQSGADVLVRINAPLRLAVEDVVASVGPHVRGLIVPKCESADWLLMLSDLLDELEKEREVTPGTTLLVPLIESCAGFFRMREIAGAHPRVAAIGIGSEDFSASAGMMPDAENLLYPKQQMILAAREAGVIPLGYIGSIANLSSDSELVDAGRRARRLGSMGAMTVHPAQVPLLNEGFSPMPDEIEEAKQLMDAFAAAKASGTGAFRHRGRMVDEAVVLRARVLLESVGRQLS